LNILAARPHAEIARQFGIALERALVLPAGVRALQSICEFYQVESLTITVNGIRQGMIIDELVQQGRWPC